MGYMRNIFNGISRLTVSKSQMIDYIGERMEHVDEEIIDQVLSEEKNFLKEKNIMY